jgi:hypothetical protein
MPMNLYINDFSFRSGEESQDFEKIVREFISVCERTRSYSFENLYMPTDFKSRELIQGNSFISYISQTRADSLLRQRLNSLMANYLKKIDNDESDNNSIQYVKWNDEESEFFKRAFNKNVPVISLKNKAAFSNHQLNIKNEYLNSREEVIESQEVLNNISEIAHFTLLNEFLSHKQREFADLKGRWDAIGIPIRFRDRVSNYLRETNYNTLWANGDEKIKVSLAHHVGRHIAEINGWQYKPNLSRKNNRKVFKALNQSVYMSIDTLHGTFEVHDKKGLHCFEINFIGELLEGGQNRHNLEI